MVILVVMTIFSSRCRCIVFFFKQKTAYEMRISDWSSDVCSSDLRSKQVFRQADATDRHRRLASQLFRPRRQRQVRTFKCGDAEIQCACRSEEHTSELQSLMRISYAAFCLKKQMQYHRLHDQQP